MKKLLVAIALLSMVGFAQADQWWNLIWQIDAAFAPETDPNDMVPILQDYSVTWSLLGEGLADPIGQYTQAAVGAGNTVTFGHGDFNEYLYCTGESIYTVATDILPTETVMVYQRIEASNGTDTYVWESDKLGLKPSGDLSVPPDTVPGQTVDIGYDGAWTKVDNPQTVPEPATLSLLGLGALAMVLRRKVRK